jgi:hypothetical protein
MKWTVVWNGRADQTLAQLWLDANSELRERISLATSTIDRILGEGADSAGESREMEQRRMLFVEPLAVTFDFLPDDCIANVLSVHLYGKRSAG